MIKMTEYNPVYYSKAQEANHSSSPEYAADPNTTMTKDNADICLVPTSDAAHQTSIYNSNNTNYQNVPEEIVGQNLQRGAFIDQSVRHSFIRKVYGILMMQEFIAATTIAVFCYLEPMRRFIRYNSDLIWWVSLIVMFACLVFMCLSTKLQRKTPLNYVSLILFTFAQAFMLAGLTCIFGIEVVLVATALLVPVCLGVILFVSQSRWSFTVAVGCLSTILIILLFSVIIVVLIPGKSLTVMFGAILSIFFSVYLICDTQRLMTYENSVFPDEYIYTAVQLYNIFNIFSSFCCCIVACIKNA